MKKNIYVYSNLLAWGLVFLLIGNNAFGWTTPSQNPPAGNITPSFSQWTTSGSNIYYNTGNVGIGTTSPAQKLHVAGNLEVDGAIVAPEGTLRDDAGGWVRTYGATGWYSQTYGGGWYMTDSSYIRNYGSKQVLLSNNLHMNNHKITNLAAPTADTDAATKGYVDASSARPHITTFRTAYNCSTDCATYAPAAWCPSGWTIVTSWCFTQRSGDACAGGSILGTHFRQTLCRLD